MVAGDQTSEPAPSAGWEHDRVAFELLGAVRERTGQRAEQNGELGRRLNKRLCAIEIGTSVIKQHVVPDSSPARETRCDSNWTFELHDRHDRQPCSVALGEKIGGDNRLIPL
jgi:hypothetical protein